MTIENIPYSFVKMDAENVHPVPSCDSSDYAMIKGDDVRFQFVIVAADATELAKLLAPLSVRAYISGFWSNTSSNWEATDLGANKVLFTLPANIPDFQYLTEGECIRFGLQWDTTANIVYTLQCFKILLEAPNTTLLQYGNMVDQNGFYYCDVPGYINKIRLPMLINDISFDGVDNIYRYSDGRQVNPAGFRNKILHFQTDYMPFEFLDYLQAALLSKKVEVTTDLYTGEIVNTGPIEPEFNDSISDMRKTPRVAFTAYATPYYLALNSCTSCAT